MGKLIDAIIKKWFCCHDWELKVEEKVEKTDCKLMKYSTEKEKKYTTSHIRLHYICRKCGKYMTVEKGNIKISKK